MNEGGGKEIQHGFGLKANINFRFNVLFSKIAKSRHQNVFFGPKLKQADKEPCLSQVVLKYMCMDFTHTEMIQTQ